MLDRRALRCYLPAMQRIRSPDISPASLRVEHFPAEISPSEYDRVTKALTRIGSAWLRAFDGEEKLRLKRGFDEPGTVGSDPLDDLSRAFRPVLQQSVRRYWSEAGGLRTLIERGVPAERIYERFRLDEDGQLYSFTNPESLKAHAIKKPFVTIMWNGGQIRLRAWLVAAIIKAQGYPLYAPEFSYASDDKLKRWPGLNGDFDCKAFASVKIWRGQWVEAQRVIEGEDFETYNPLTIRFPMWINPETLMIEPEPDGKEKSRIQSDAYARELQARVAKMGEGLNKAAPKRKRK